MFCCRAIEYKLLSLTYKVLTTSQPDYLHNLISVQSSGRTRSSSVVTLARSSVSSSLQITNRSFTYTSPLESTPFFIPSTSLCSLSSWLTSSYAYHLITVITFVLTISLSLPRLFTPDLKLISFTNPCLHSHSYSFRTDFTVLNLYCIGTGVVCFSFFFWLRVLDKAEYSAFESTLNSAIVSYRKGWISLKLTHNAREYMWVRFDIKCLYYTGDKTRN